jgi:hypothetical protein
VDKGLLKGIGQVFLGAEEDDATLGDWVSCQSSDSVGFEATKRSWLAYLLWQDLEASHRHSRR